MSPEGQAESDEGVVGSSAAQSDEEDARSNEAKSDEDDVGSSDAQSDQEDARSSEAQTHAEDALRSAELRAFKTALGDLLATAFKEHPQGSFAGSGHLNDSPNPGLNVDGLGALGLPLSAHDAERIIVHSEQSACGTSDPTFTVLSVRRTWEIDAAKVEFRNPAWATYVQTQVMEKIGGELGIPPLTIKAHLYKLLLYGEGGHLEGQQNTEEEPGMFGTLVIILPSLFTGGQVTVSHLDKEVTFDTAPHSEFSTCFTCLYTDVFHEVQPVTSGYRLALAYNLAVTGSGNPLPRAPVASGPILQLRDTFKAWLARMDGNLPVPEFVAHFLDHQYSTAGLNFDSLIRQDRVKVAYLLDIAQELAFSIYLAQIDIIVRGTGEYEERSNHRMWYDSYSDDEGSDDTMAEETKRDCKLRTGVAPDGSEILLASLHLTEDDTFPRYDVNDWTYDEKDDEGHLGGRAGEVTHYYHRTVVLLWPKSRDLEMSMRTGGVKDAVADIDRLLLSYDGIATEDGDTPAGERSQIERIARALPVEEATVASLAKAGLALGDLSIFQRVGKLPFSLAAASWVDAVRAFGFMSVRDMLYGVTKSCLPWERDDTIERVFAVLDQIAASFVEEEPIMSWTADTMKALLSDNRVVTYVSVKHVVDYAKRAGFVRSRSLLNSLLAKMTVKVRHLGFPFPHYALRPTSTTIEVTVEAFEAFVRDEQGSVWCKDKLLLLVAKCETFSADNVFRVSLDDATRLTRFVELCIDYRPAFIPEFLDQFRRPSYTTSYLTATIKPIVSALDDLLADRSLTLMTTPFDDFTVTFINIGLKIFRPPVPALPGDYTLPAVGHPQLDSFLQSSIQHILKIQGDSPTRSQCGTALAQLRQQNRVTLTTDRNSTPHTLVVRKCNPTPRPVVPIRHLLTWTFEQEWTQHPWTGRVCQDACEACDGMRSCQKYLEAERTMQRYLASFGGRAIKAFRQHRARLRHPGHYTQPATATVPSSHGTRASGKRKASDAVDLTDESPKKVTRQRIST